MKENCLNQDVLIVGGGPAGLATALMLAKRGWKNITVLEQRATADYYEPDKSFNYLIDGRGQKFTDYLGITDTLAELGVSTENFYLTRIYPDGKHQTSKLPILDPNRRTAYWIMRKSFVLMLYQEIVKNWQDAIKVIFNARCEEIKRIAINNQEEKLEVIAAINDENIIKFTPNLLVGCDGVNSCVRNTLATWNTPVSGKFQMQRFPSPSAGLRYKVLTLPPKPQLDPEGKEYAVSEIGYIILGALRSPQRYLRLGILPIHNPEEPRTANVITLPDHEVWNLTDSESLYRFFQQSFPQLPLDKILSPEESDRFAKSSGAYFPKPQYCPGLYFLLDSPGLGIVLLGDTIHCFPPDIGQGVNSALEDVCVFHDALTQANDDISKALPLYESLRLADTKALVRLAQTAFPWQYGQSRFRLTLWSINFFFWLTLNRLFPFLFHPPAFFLIQNHQLAYQDILAKVQRNHRNLFVIGLVFICIFIIGSWQLK